MSTRRTASGTSRKHAGSQRHGTAAHGGGSNKHHPQHQHQQPQHQNPQQHQPPVVGRSNGPRKRRGLTPGDVACCVAEALAALGRAAGCPVTHEDTLDLYWRTASDPDQGATIEDTLKAWALMHAPAWNAHTSYHGLILGCELPAAHAIAVAPDGTWWSWGQPFNPADWPDLIIEEAWEVSWP